MPVKIRLARHGSKKKPFYHVVVADSRAPRDGRYIERIGSYNPNTNPVTIDLDFDKALDWVKKGAIPTDTCRAILSTKGVMYKKHLLEGVKKGSFPEEEGERKFNIWIKDKELKIETQRKKLEKVKEDEVKKRMSEEEKVNEARKAELAKKKLDEMEASKEVKSEGQPVAETKKDSVAKAEEISEKQAEKPAKKPKEETPVEEAKAEEVKEETPAEEPKAEETEEVRSAEENESEEKSE